MELVKEVSCNAPNALYLCMEAKPNVLAGTVAIVPRVHKNPFHVCRMPCVSMHPTLFDEPSHSA
jgi:hypothetical protein